MYCSLEEKWQMSTTRIYKELYAVVVRDLPLKIVAARQPLTHRKKAANVCSLLLHLRKIHGRVGRRVGKLIVDRAVIARCQFWICCRLWGWGWGWGWSSC